jgi:hypothetical protein
MIFTMSNQQKHEPMTFIERIREEDQEATRAMLADYDSASSEISPDEHGRNLAILKALSATGINPLLAKDKVDREVEAVFNEETKRVEGEYSSSARIGMQYDGFVDVDAWTRPDKE